MNGVAMIDALEIGYSIKEKRLGLGMTQAQLAEAAGVSKRSLWSMELGQNSGVQLDKLTSVLNVLGLELEIKESGERCSGGAEHHHGSEVMMHGVNSRLDVMDALAILTEGSR